MNAFFSDTDDADEIRSGLYGVIGRCNTPFPQAKFRYSCAGKFQNVDASELFEDDVEGVVTLV